MTVYFSSIDAFVVLEFAQEEADEEERVLRAYGHAMRVFEDRLNPLENYNDTKFIRRYRISKELFRWLLNLIEDDLLPETRRNHALTPLQQLSVTLCFYASASFQMDIGDMCGVSQPTCCRAIHRVTAAICANKRHFIYFPDSPHARRVITEGFYEIMQFPGIIGAIECSHVAIVCPGSRFALRFMNSKGYYSLNCQFVCDHRYMFTNVVAIWYGSAHDSRFFLGIAAIPYVSGRGIPRDFGWRPGLHMSPIYAYSCPQPCHTSGDSFNDAQRRTRNVIGRTFGIWKRRFPCISKGIHQRCSLEHNMAIIVATACLHNLARRRNDPLPEPDLGLPQGNVEDPNQQPNQVEADLRGNIFRQRFIMQHFNH